MNAIAPSNVIPMTPVQSHTPPKTLRVLRIKDVMKKIGIARSTLYDWMNPKSPRYDAIFPRCFKIGRHSVGWLEHQIDEWLSLRAAALLAEDE